MGSMKTVAVVGKNKVHVRQLLRELTTAGFRSSTKPGLVISLGGDGTYLFAERKFPHVPKILIRDNSICYQCNDHTLHEIITSLTRNQFIIQKNMMLAATVTTRSGKKQKKQMTCVNDFILRNKDPTQALRFTTLVNGKAVEGTIIGDGVVVATPFGSTGYFYSITRKKFSKGIGVAFNNTTLPLPAKILSDHSSISITILRNAAQLSADNNPSIITLHPGDTVTITKSSRTAQRVMLTSGLKGMIDKLFNNQR